MEKGVLETLTIAISKAFEKGIGRKNLITLTSMIVLATMAEAPLWLCCMVMGIAIVAILTQWNLDRLEVKQTGKDQPDNGANSVGLTNKVPKSPVDPADGGKFADTCSLDSRPS